MKAKKYELPILIDPVIYKDHRGWFFESFHADNLKLETHFIQDNHSYSEKKGTLRGLHLQLPPHEQSKLIRVIRGRVLDVIVDLRPKSADYLSHYTYHLDDILRQSLYIPKGFAHGFLTLEDHTEVVYKVDSYYSPSHEVTLRFDDDRLAINWQIDYNEIIISDKDKHGLSLEELIQMLSEHS